MNRESSGLFKPLDIANGKIRLEHRIVHAPVTRNRGVPLNATSIPENPNRVWYPGELMAKYYGQRATKGGLIISEAIPITLESSGMPGSSGLFIPEQAEGWKKVVDAVHEQGGYVYGQLWHAGRATIPQMIGAPPVSASATPWDSPTDLYAYPPVGETERVRYADYPPIECSIEGIKAIIQDYCKAARTAMEIGFDGVEVTSANGYLLEQFLSTNVNKRTDEYGGSMENRCRVVLELMDELAKTVGEDNLAIRLTPFGLFNQNRSEQRVETWSYLCQSLKRSLKLSYVSFIEPRFEQFDSYEYKDDILRSWGLLGVTLDKFRTIFGNTPFFSGGGFDDTNCWEVVESGTYNGLLFGRLFGSNPDLVERLKKGLKLSMWDDNKLFGPFEDNSVGYVDYPIAECI